MIGVEHCDRCGFDRNQWNEQDAKRTIAHAGSFLVEWSADAPVPLMAQLEARRIDDLKAISTSPDLFDEVHHLWHGLVSIADVRRAAGDVVARHRGTVTQISASGGGVPKTAVDAATVGVRGIDGDIQAARAHHGRPWQALCLWSQEVIDGFAAAGHPIAPGNAGENLTVSGIDWAALHGGTVIDIGAVRVQLSRARRAVHEERAVVHRRRDLADGPRPPPRIESLVCVGAASRHRDHRRRRHRQPDLTSRLQPYDRSTRATRSSYAPYQRARPVSRTTVCSTCCFHAAIASSVAQYDTVMPTPSLRDESTPRNPGCSAANSIIRTAAAA